MRATASHPVRITETFPSPTELTVAKALLLLSSKPFLIKSRNEDSSSSLYASSSVTTTDASGARVVQLDCLRTLAVAAHPHDLNLKKDWKSEGDKSSSPTDSKCSSTVTSEVSSVENAEVDRIGAVTVVSYPHDLKLKVIRRRRSKHYRRSDCREKTSDLLIKPASVTPFRGKEDEREVSSLSNAYSSGVLALCAPKRQVIRAGKGSASVELKRKQAVCSYLKRRAEIIFKFLSAGSASEVRIRQVIGNSPDTSKALRMLLKLERVKRSGAGGQKDPYIYMVAGSDSDVESA